MTLPLTQNYLRILLLVSLCVASGVVTSRAQNSDYGSGAVEQEIERLQRILELQRQIETLQGANQVGGANQGAGGANQGGGAQAQQPAQSQQPSTSQPARQATQAPLPSVTFSPVDTGRSAVTFTFGEPARQHDRYALKMNLLYGVGLMAPNIGFEMAVGNRMTVGVAGGYSNWGNMWDFSAKGPDYDPGNSYRRRIDHMAAGAEFRYWLGQRFEGHFVGVNTIWSKFVVGEAKLPPLFEKMNENKGFLYGGGFTYGYLWQFAERWGAEFTIGAGVTIVEHDQRAIGFAEGTFTLGDPERFRKTFVGPTSAGITIVYKL